MVPLPPRAAHAPTVGGSAGGGCDGHGSRGGAATLLGGSGTVAGLGHDRHDGPEAMSSTSKVARSGWSVRIVGEFLLERARARVRGLGLGGRGRDCLGCLGDLARIELDLAGSGGRLLARIGRPVGVVERGAREPEDATTSVTLSATEVARMPRRSVVTWPAPRRLAVRAWAWRSSGGRSSPMRPRAPRSACRPSGTCCRRSRSSCRRSR